MRDIEKYTQEYLSNSQDFENYMVCFRRRKIIELLQKYQPNNILEIGCGMDSLFNYYKDFRQACIVEPSKEFFLKAKKDLSDYDITFFNDFVENKIEILSLKKFDYIILSGLLHEVQEPKMFLQEIFKIATKDTIIHINVPNSHSFHLLWAYESGLIKEIGRLSDRAKNLQQHSSFSLHELESFVLSVLKNESISILDKGSYFIKPFNHDKMSLCIREQIIDEKLLDGLYNMIQYMPEFGSEIFINIKKL